MKLELCFYFYIFRFFLFFLKFCNHYFLKVLKEIKGILKYNKCYEIYTILGIVDYMLEQAKPAAKKLNTVKETQRFFKKDDVTILGFFSDEHSKLFDALTDTG